MPRSASRPSAPPWSSRGQRFREAVRSCCGCLAAFALGTLHAVHGLLEDFSHGLTADQVIEVWPPVGVLAGVRSGPVEELRRGALGPERGPEGKRLTAFASMPRAPDRGLPRRCEFADLRQVHHRGVVPADDQAVGNRIGSVRCFVARRCTLLLFILLLFLLLFL